MRTDYAMLSRLQLQSTSDQQDFLRYPAIAAAAPAASRVWRRPPFGTADPGPSTVTLPVPHLRGRALSPRMLYPAAGPLTATLPGVPSACLLALTSGR
jgi:hypothetical protein